MLHIINQDRDAIFRFNGKGLYKQAKYYEGDFMGYNLYLGANLLGTFDTVEEVEAEVCTILHCEHEIYAVSGHSKGWYDDPVFSINWWEIDD